MKCQSQAWLWKGATQEEWQNPGEKQLYAPKELQNKNSLVLYIILLYMYVYIYIFWDKKAAHFFSEEDKGIDTCDTNSDQLRNIICNSPVTMTFNQAKLQYSLFMSKWGISKIEVILTAWVTVRVQGWLCALCNTLIPWIQTCILQDNWVPKYNLSFQWKKTYTCLLTPGHKTAPSRWHGRTRNWDAFFHKFKVNSVLQKQGKERLRICNYFSVLQ